MHRLSIPDLTDLFLSTKANAISHNTVVEPSVLKSAVFGKFTINGLSELLTLAAVIGSVSS